MTRTGYLALCMALIGLNLAACGDDSSSTGGDTDSGPGGDGDASSWEDTFPRNLDCPAGPPPTMGEGSQHGECCFRGKPNSVRLEEQGDGPLVSVGYRMNYQGPGNLFDTLAAAPLPTLAITRADLHEQILLIQSEGPREGGKGVSGPGFSTVGGGVYNCDGTYSFYGDQAAPTNAAATYPGANDPSRWQKRRIPVTVDATKKDQDRIQIAWEDNYRGYSYTSFVESGTDPFVIDWEIVTENFTMLDFTYDEDNPDCVGSRDVDVWKPDGSFAVYAQVQWNNDKANDIKPLAGQNFCQLVSFGVLSDPDDLANLDCELTPRCTPGSADCRWKALPDSLCPENEADQDIFACHVGAADNADGVTPNCTATAPTEHTEDSEGQCCSALGDDPSLPACNAWRIVSEIVAASANITEEVSNEPIDRCPDE